MVPAARVCHARRSRSFLGQVQSHWLPRLLRNPLLQPHPKTKPVHHYTNPHLGFLLPLRRSDAPGPDALLSGTIFGPASPDLMLCAGCSTRVSERCFTRPNAPHRIVNPQARQLQPVTEVLLQLRMRMIFQHLPAGPWTFSFHPETPLTSSTSLTPISQAVTTGCYNTSEVHST